MIELTKSSRVAYEALPERDKKQFMGLYHQIENDPKTLWQLYQAKKLPNIDNTYLLKVSEQFRAIVHIEDNKIIILEVVKHDTLQRLFFSSKAFRPTHEVDILHAGTT